MDQDKLAQKAELKDLAKLNDIKSNKFDTDFLMNCTDIHHRQLEHLAVLLIETVKTLIQTQVMGAHEKNIKRI